MDIGYARQSIRSLLRSGQEVRDKAHADRQPKVPCLHVADLGYLDQDGTPVAACPRKAHLRYKGIEIEPSDSSKIMFNAGYANETVWEELLTAAQGDGWLFQETLLKVLSTLEGEVNLTGHPDAMGIDPTSQKEYVLEFKLLSAVRSAVQVYTKVPELKHLIQLTTYMWITGAPGVLCYTMPMSIQTMFYKKQASCDRIEPYYSLYYLKLDRGKLAYREEFEINDRPTDVTVRGIEDFAHLAVSDQVLQSPRPRNMNALGECIDDKYTLCQYCPFSDVCDGFEKRGYQEWLDAARRHKELL